MKTIAISIEEATLRRLRDWAGLVGVGPSPGRGPRRNLSRLVREALREYLDRLDRTERERRDRASLARHRDLLRRQAEALVGEQAKP